MSSIAILSPHRDDAAFSCGLTMVALLRAGAAITVVNVFTRSDYAIDLRTVDSTLPLVDGVSHARLLEDRNFIVDVTEAAKREAEAIVLHDLGNLDAPLRLAVQTEQVLHAPLTDARVQDEAHILAGQLALDGFDLVFAPLALGDHIDHRVVREAAKLSLPGTQVCLYEDLPYAARLSSAERKEQAVRALSSNYEQKFERFTLQMPQGSHLKHRFAMHYPSQIAPNVADEIALYAAEHGGGQAGGERWWATEPTRARVSRMLEQAVEPVSLSEDQR